MMADDPIPSGTFAQFPTPATKLRVRPRSRVVAALLAWHHVVWSVVRRVIGVLSLVVFGILGVVVAVVPWAVDRLFGWDPLDRAQPRARWIGVRGAAPTSERPWARARAVGAVTGPARARRTLMRSAWAVVLIAGLGDVAVRFVREETSAVDSSVIESPAMAGSPWWPRYAVALDQLRMRTHMDSYLNVVLPDVARSPHLNIVDGRRVTWNRPRGTCEPIRVWMFGGSTMFGEGQRDDHTIPSVVARLAAERGLPVEVRNYGVLGDTSWIAARRFEAALAEATEHPDLVVFYDGINEYEPRQAANVDGGADQFAIAYGDSNLLPALEDTRDLVLDLVAPADAITIVPRRPRVLDAGELGARMATQYESAVSTERVLAERHGVAAFWFEQPTIYTRQEPVNGEPVVGAADMSFADEAFREYRRAFPPGIVDLTQVFDGIEEPIYRDSSHTNERGARIVAGAMFDHIEPALAAKCGGRRECC